MTINKILKQLEIHSPNWVKELRAEYARLKKENADLRDMVKDLRAACEQKQEGLDANKTIVQENIELRQQLHILTDDQKVTIQEMEKAETALGVAEKTLTKIYEDGHTAGCSYALNQATGNCDCVMRDAYETLQALAQIEHPDPTTHLDGIGEVPVDRLEEE